MDLPIPDGTVVVGVDGTSPSRHALHWAVDQAVAQGRALSLVHAGGPIGSVWSDQSGHDTRVGLRGAETHQEQARRVLQDERAEVRRRAPDLEVHELLRVADPRDVLVQASRRAELVVVGSRGLGALRGVLLGSVGIALVRHAACPSVVVRPGNPGLVRHGVLVGADATERSLPVLELAYRMASLRRLPLTVMHTFAEMSGAVAHPPRGGVEADAAPELDRIDLSESMSGLQERYPDVHVRATLARGLPTEGLLHEAARMDLVVVGSPAWGAPSELLFGSVAGAMVRHATCPVVVVPVGDRG